MGHTVTPYTLSNIESHDLRRSMPQIRHLPPALWPKAGSLGASSSSGFPLPNRFRGRCRADVRCRLRSRSSSASAGPRPECGLSALGPVPILRSTTSDSVRSAPRPHELRDPFRSGLGRPGARCDTVRRITRKELMLRRLEIGFCTASQPSTIFLMPVPNDERKNAPYNPQTRLAWDWHNIPISWSM